MRLDAAGEIKLPAAALRTGHDEEIGKAVTVQAQERLCAFRLPFFAQGSSALTLYHLKCRCRHPLKPGGVDQNVHRIFLTVMNDPLGVYFADPKRRGVDQRDMGQVERRQEFIMKGRAFAAIGVIGFQRGGGFRVGDGGVHTAADLLHDPEIGVELFFHQLFRGKHAGVLFLDFEIGDLARQKIVVAF